MPSPTAHAQGHQSRLTFAPEATPGTLPDPIVSTILPMHSCGVRNARNFIPSSVLDGTPKRSPPADIEGFADVNGAIVVPLCANSLGHWLKAIFGAATVAGGSAPYTHTWKLDEDGESVPTFAIERRAGLNTFLLYKGCVVRSLALAQDGDGELRVTLNVAGDSETVALTTALGTPGTVTLARCLWSHLALYAGTTSVPVQLVEQQSVSVNIDFGLVESRLIGVGRRFAPGRLRVTGSVRGIFSAEGYDVLTKAIAGTAIPLKLAWTRAAGSSLTVYVDECLLKPAAPAVDGPAGIMYDLEFTAYNSSGTRGVVAVEAVNSIAAY